MHACTSLQINPECYKLWLERQNVTPAYLDQIETVLKSYKPKKEGSWRGTPVVVISSGIPGIHPHAMNSAITLQKINKISTLQSEIRSKQILFSEDVMTPKHVLSPERKATTERLKKLDNKCDKYLQKYGEIFKSQTKYGFY